MNFRLCALLLCSSVAALSQAVLISDSFTYAEGTTIHNLNSPGGFKWMTHNLASNYPNRVAAQGLSYADAGYSQFTAYGGGAFLTSEGANGPSWASSYRGSEIHETQPYNKVGNVIYGSFLAKALTGASASTELYFDSGFPFGTGFGAWHAAMYVENNQYKLVAYRENVGDFVYANSGKSTAIGQTDLIFFKFEQSTTGQQIMSIAVNPQIGPSGFAWDATVVGNRGIATSVRAAFRVSNYINQPTASVMYDEIRFASTLAEATPVPEPATMGALAFGLAAVFRRRTKGFKG